MRFFSVFDVIKYKAQQKGHSEQDMYLFFRNNKINKKEIQALEHSNIIPYKEELLNSILNYLDMNIVELELMLGRIPTNFEDEYNSKIKEIANLLLEGKGNGRKISESIDQPKACFETEHGKLFNGDCVKLLKIVENDSVDCIFADPPFNLDKDYDVGVNDKKTQSEYISWCIEWLNECIRVLKPGGSLFIYNIPKWHTFLAAHLNNKLNFLNWITVDMKFSLPIQNRLYPAHYSLLYYVKGSRPNTFNSQRMPLQTCRHCGGEIKDYGGYKNKMNPNGVNVSDVWTDIYPVRHSNSKNRKFNELPVKLLDRVISMSTNKGDIVLDPFGGSGTSFAVAELLGRRWIGFEIGNAEVIKSRLTHKEDDKKLLEKVYNEKNTLFPKQVRELRMKKGFWLPEDFNDSEGPKEQDDGSELAQPTLF